MTQALNLANFANTLNSSGQTSNSGLQNSSVTVTAGTGMSGGGAVALGSSVTLTNAGVTSVAAGTGISVSASTGAVTISSTASGGVTSLNGNTGALKGYDYINKGSFSSTTSSVSITSIPSGYQYLRLYWQSRNGFNQSSQLALRVSTNGGSTFATSSYAFGGNGNANDGSFQNSAGTSYNETSIRPLSWGQGAPANWYHTIVIDISQGTSNIQFGVVSKGTASSLGADLTQTWCTGGGYNTATYVNGLQIFNVSGGDMQTGQWTLYGAKNA